VCKRNLAHIRSLQEKSQFPLILFSILFSARADGVAVLKVQSSWDATLSAGCSNGHSLSVMSETNSRVISLTSRRSRGVKASAPTGVATVAPTRTRHGWSPIPAGLSGLSIGRVSKGENLRGECPARKGRLIAWPGVYAPPWNNADKFTVRRAMVVPSPLTRMTLLEAVDRYTYVCVSDVATTDRRFTIECRLRDI